MNKAMQAVTVAVVLSGVFAPAARCEDVGGNPKPPAVDASGFGISQTVFLVLSALHLI